MKGLVYRIFIISRKTIISGFVTMLAFIALGILFGASSRFGNLRLIMLCSDPDLTEAKLNESIAAVAKTSVYMVLFGVIVILTQSLITVTEDTRTKWKSFAYTLPVSPRKAVAAAYIVMLAEYAAAFLLFLISAAVIYGFFGMSLTLKDIAAYATLMLAGFIAILISYNTALRFGGEQKALLILFAIVYGAFMLILILCMILSEVLPTEFVDSAVKLFTRIFHVIRSSMFLFPVYSAIAAVICYHRAVVLAGRREK